MFETHCETKLLYVLVPNAVLSQQQKLNPVITLQLFDPLPQYLTVYCGGLVEQILVMPIVNVHRKRIRNVHQARFVRINSESLRFFHISSIGVQLRLNGAVLVVLHLVRVFGLDVGVECWVGFVVLTAAALVLPFAFV